MKLKVVSIFRSLDGEVTKSGPLNWTTFIRLGGCNLRCWKSSGLCDTPHSLKMTEQYDEYEPEELAIETVQNECKRATITGGEPLLQLHPLVLLCRCLKSVGIQVSIETNGSLPIAGELAPYVDCFVMDLKTPSTEMSEAMRIGNFYYLRPQDIIKVIVGDEADLDWALAFLNDPSLSQVECHKAVSPTWGKVEPRKLVEWMEKRKLFDWTFNLQLHKYIWPETIKTEGLTKEQLIELER